MKTPREILLARHRAAEPKLDKLREQVLANLACGANELKLDSAQQAVGWHSFREFLISIRWHLAGLSAAWGLILLLGLESGDAAKPTGSRQASVSPRQVMLTLRENRRQLREYFGSAASEEPPAAKSPQPDHRSQIQIPTTVRFFV